ncbi:HNH endonuclease [Paraburkholderia sediminicola]|uniref:HNH endonuclease n=1 Tax=Paraburkholderia sediminicola TaxID=458836 RepID=UPI0038B927E0
MKTCIYCAVDKDESDFSDEHIWPDALGGDYLSDFWRTGDVCQRCNNLSGVFVDGSFIKSWAGSAERATGAREYLAVKHADRAALPLDYLGKLEDERIAVDEVADFWSGPCGANIIHFRPADKDDVWISYAGGDPRAGNKVSKAGRVYIVLTTDKQFWIAVTINSVRAHFKKAALFVTNIAVQGDAGWLKNPDRTDSVQSADMQIIDTIVEAGRSGTQLHLKALFQVDLGSRLLAKLGLAIGYKAFGSRFLATAYGNNLRLGFREADPEKRKAIPVKGTGYLRGGNLGGAEAVMTWTGAWVLVLMRTRQTLTLTVITPSGKVMHVVVCDDPALINELPSAYDDGKVWITVPSLGAAVGPLWLPDYLAHQLHETELPELAALAAKRVDLATLPAC